jgi:2-oxoglutarate dehydrogenase E2 component (dihydrolipoamide succinyltransferase)
MTASEAPVSASASETPSPSAAAPQSRVMPAADRMLKENNLPASAVSGTGPGGRLLKEDVARHIISGGTAVSMSGSRETKSVPMSPIRQTIAKRLLSAQQNAALLTTFNEIDMYAVKELRQQYKDAFEKKYGVKLGFMSFFVRAVVDALQEYPSINAQMDGNKLVYHNYCDIGIAVGGGKGLVVPMLRNAENMSLAEIEQAIRDFGARAQKNQITLEELEGGTFTITNGGVYGSLLSTPIVNPPQSGVLGMHGIVDRPVAVNGQVVIRPMMYVALTYDHCVVDGKEAVTFLKRIKEVIEDPARLILEV